MILKEHYPPQDSFKMGSGGSSGSILYDSREQSWLLTHHSCSILLFFNKFKDTCPDLVEGSGTNPDDISVLLRLTIRWELQSAQRELQANGWLYAGIGMPSSISLPQSGTMQKDYPNLRTHRARTGWGLSCNDVTGQLPSMPRSALASVGMSMEVTWL